MFLGQSVSKLRYLCIDIDSHVGTCWVNQVNSRQAPLANGKLAWSRQREVGQAPPHAEGQEWPPASASDTGMLALHTKQGSTQR